MREVLPKFSAEIFVRHGFPYPGELSYGHSSGLIDRDLLLRIVEELQRMGLPLAREEARISRCLHDETESISDFIDALRKYEKNSSKGVWHYYVSKAIGEAVADPETRFLVLYSAWVDFDYPMEMKEVIYPEGDLPSTIDVSAGQIALRHFLERWESALEQRVSERRLEFET